MFKLTFLFCFILLKYVLADSFHEELLIEGLPDSHTHLHFQFTTATQRPVNEKNTLENYELFPKRLGDIVKKFQISEFRLSLTQGTWKYDNWGQPSVSVPTGGELWAAFENVSSPQLIDSHWLQSSRALSCLFGLSINLQDNPNTVEPTETQIFSSSPRKMRYAAVPNEFVCTENLTPWIKLLPCGKQKGLAQLFKNSHKLFEAHYLSFSIHFKETCLDPPFCTRLGSELKQTMSVVYDIETLNKRPSAQEVKWSLLNIFGQKVVSSCPVAQISRVYWDLNQQKGSASVEPTESIKKGAKTEIQMFDLKSILGQSNDFNPLFTIQKQPFSVNSHVSVHRYITDMNERNFGLKTLLKNSHPTETFSIVYFESIPWYFRVFINSLRIYSETSKKWLEPKKIHFVPGLDNKRAHHIELLLDLQPKSDYSIYFQLSKAYLKWDEFPPDVNHGFFINPALVSVVAPKLDLWPQFRSFNQFQTIHDSLSPNSSVNVNSNLVNIYSETLLMNLPTPDFSMPYNVICLTCTVIAIAFGSIHNFTTRKFIFCGNETKLKKFLNKIKSAILAIFKK